MAKSVDLSTVGGRIRYKRIAAGLTQEQLAEKMCIPKPTVSAYENDRVDIKSSIIIELAEALFTNPNFLLLGEDNCGSDPIIDEIIDTFRRIKDEKIRELLLVQMRAVSSI